MMASCCCGETIDIEAEQSVLDGDYQVQANGYVAEGGEAAAFAALRAAAFAALDPLNDNWQLEPVLGRLGRHEWEQIDEDHIAIVVRAYYAGTLRLTWDTTVLAGLSVSSVTVRLVMAGPGDAPPDVSEDFAFGLFETDDTQIGVNRSTDDPDGTDPAPYWDFALDPEVLNDEGDTVLEARFLSSVNDDPTVWPWSTNEDADYFQCTLGPTAGWLIVRVS